MRTMDDLNALKLVDSFNQCYNEWVKCVNFVEKWQGPCKSKGRFFCRSLKVCGWGVDVSIFIHVFI